MSDESSDLRTGEAEIHGMAGHLIRRLHQMSTQVFQSRAKAVEVDLTPVQFAAMMAIRDHPRIDQAGIAALIAYDRATIGGVIDRLEQKGHVSRTISRRDRRAREVQLTSRGESVLAGFLPHVRAFQTDILPGLTESERAQFLALARKAAHADDADQSPGRST